MQMRLSILERKLDSEVGLFYLRGVAGQGDKGCSPKGICHLSSLRKTHSDIYTEVPLQNENVVPLPRYQKQEKSAVKACTI